MIATRRRASWLAATLLLAVAAAGAHPGIDEQIADVNRKIEADPDNGELYLRRGELHRIHRDWAQATADYERARARAPGLDVVDLCTGRVLLEAGRPAEALAALDRYVERRPGEVEGWIVRGRARAELGRYLQAADDFTRGIAAVGEGRPKPEYFLDRARALDAAGPENRPRALRGLEEGLAALGRPVTLDLLALDLEVRLGRFDAALARLERMAQASPRQETWLVRRGEILEQAGRPAEARQAYEKTLEAIEALPASRRRNRAVERLADTARTAIDRLSADAGS